MKSGAVNAILNTLSKLLQIFSRHLPNKHESPFCSKLKATTARWPLLVHRMHAERIAKAVWLYVFKIAFPASLLPLRKLLFLNPAYRRHQLSQPMRVVGPIQFWRGCVIYQQKKYIYRLSIFSKKKVLGKPWENHGKTPGNPGNTPGKQPQNPGKTLGEGTYIKWHCDSMKESAILHPLWVKVFKSETTFLHYFSPRISKI